MQKLTTKLYQQQQADCESLCSITETMVQADPEFMRCVSCPFCKQTVDAILTPTTIACPKCHVVVNR